MTYQEQLETKQWKEKRKGIVLRDNCVCQRCGNARIIQNTTKITITPKVTDKFIAFTFFNKGESHFKLFSKDLNPINLNIHLSPFSLTEVFLSEVENIVNIYVVKLYKLDF